MKGEMESRGTHLGSLVVFNDAAERTLRRRESTIEQVHVDLLRVTLLLGTASDLECSRFCSFVVRQYQRQMGSMRGTYGSRCSC